MKTEINNESRVRFFGQHLNQKVLFNPTFPNHLMVLNVTTLADYHEGDILELKPISSISNEDAMAITIYWAFKPNNLNEYGYTDIRGFKFYTYSSVDYLRSKGYAMPFHELRVEQMVNAGWIKLKED